MSGHDRLELISHLSPTGSPFIVLGIIDNSYQILLVNNNTPYLTSIDNISNGNVAYCVRNADRTVIISQLDGIRCGYINCNPNHVLTCDREAGTIFTIAERNPIDSIVVEDVRLSGMSYSLYSSNLQAAISTPLGDVLLSDITWLMIPITLRSRPTPVRSSVPITIESVSAAVDKSISRIPAYTHYKRWMSRWLLILITVIVIASVYLVTNKSQFRISSIKIVN